MFEILRIAKVNKNARLYLIYRLINSLWFIEACWYFYWGRFLSYSQVGIVFAYLVVLGIVAEIPTGVIADKWGRKFSVIIGTIMLAVGGVINTMTQMGWELVVGTSFMTIGRAFISGALEAMVYDSLVVDELEGYWDKLMSFRIQLSLIAYSIAVPLGGFAYTYFFRLPNILETSVLIISIYIATKFVDKVDGVKVEKIMGISDYVAGFKELTKTDLKPYLISSFLIITTYELYDWGLSKPAMALSFGFDSRWQSIIYTVISIINIIFVSALPFLRRKLGDYFGLITLNLVAGIGFVISAYIFNYWGVIAMLMIEMSGNIGDPWTSAIVNKYTASRYRATTISTLAFLAQIPHFFVNILAGNAIDGVGIAVFHRVLGIVIMIVAMGVWMGRKAYLTNKA